MQISTIIELVKLSEQISNECILLEILYEAITHVPNPVIITDENANIIWVNPAFENHTGYKKNRGHWEKPKII